MMPDFENCTGNEGCTCSDCVQARAEFDAWVADTDARWAKAERDGRVAKPALTAPSGIVMEVVS